MKERLAIILLLSIICSCQEPLPQVKPIPFHLFEYDYSKGVTEKMQRWQYRVLDSLQKAFTLNRQIPALEVQGLKGNTTDLREIVAGQKSLLLIGASNCHACKISFFENFPIILDSLSEVNKFPRVISLIVKGDYDKYDTKRFKNYLVSSKKHYPDDTYIIDHKEAEKINIHSYPMRYYLNKRQIVMNIKSGAELDNLKKRHFELNSFFY